MFETKGLYCISTVPSLSHFYLVKTSLGTLLTSCGIGFGSRLGMPGQVRDRFFVPPTALPQKMLAKLHV